MHAEANHIRLMMDGRLCQTSANFMLRGSDLTCLPAALRPEICGRRAADCDRMSDDPRMAACAEECRRCSESCRRMANQMTH